MQHLQKIAKSHPAAAEPRAWRSYRRLIPFARQMLQICRNNTFNAIIDVN